MTGYFTVGRLLLAGRLAEAEQVALETRDLGVSSGQPDAHLIYGTQRFYIYLEQGRLAELADVDHTGVSLQPGEYRYPTVPWPRPQHVQGVAHDARGDYTDGAGRDEGEGP